MLSRTRAWQLALVAGLATLAAAVAAAQWLVAPATDIATDTKPAAAVADVEDPLPDPPAPTAAVPVESQPAPVRWQGGQLQVDVDSEPLDQAMSQLADATHSTVSGRQLLAGSARVTMHWYASDAKTAWQLMLHDRARFELRCDPSACQVTIVSQLAPPAAPGDAAAKKRAAPKEPTQEEVSQPDGAC